MNLNELRMRLDSVRDCGPNELQARLLNLMYENLGAGAFSDEFVDQLTKLEMATQPSMDVPDFLDMLLRIFEHHTFLKCIHKHLQNAEAYSGWKRYQIIWHDLRPVFIDKSSAIIQKLADQHN